MAGSGPVMRAAKEGASASAAAPTALVMALPMVDTDFEHTGRTVKGKGLDE